jgi:hypothetical protein
MLRIFVGLGFGGSEVPKLIHGLFRVMLHSGKDVSRMSMLPAMSPGECSAPGRAWLGWVGVLSAVGRR